MIVGSFFYATGKGQPIVYTSTDSGNNWIEHDVFGGFGDFDYRSFESVACDIDNRCTVIGFASKQGQITPIIYSTINSVNGWTWRAHAFANDSDPIQNICTAGINVSVSGGG